MKVYSKENAAKRGYVYSKFRYSNSGLELHGQRKMGDFHKRTPL